MVESTRPAPILCYFGHHKCATQWIAAILDDVFNVLELAHQVVHNPRMFNHDLRAHVKHHGLDAVSYINAENGYIDCLKSFRGFHVIRDPRDIVVSAYFSHLYSHPTEGWPDLAAHRTRLMSMSKEDGLHLEMEFSRSVFEAMRSWRYDRPVVLEVKMETLVVDPERGFASALQHLGLMLGGPSTRAPTLSPSQLQDILLRHSYSKKAGGRQPGEEDVRSHYRRGQAGDWRNHFTRSHVTSFKRRFNELLLLLGYESDGDWR